MRADSTFPDDHILGINVVVDRLEVLIIIECLIISEISFDDTFSDKMAVEMDIETSMSAAKMEQNMMSVMPILLVALIKISSPEFAENFSSVTGIISTTVAVILFVAAALIAKSIMNIKV